MTSTKSFRIGVVSDTHSLLRPEALAALEGSDLIVHAGDVGSHDVLQRLAEIAPVHAIRGNIDCGGECGDLPDTRTVEACGKRLFLIHNLAELDELAPDARSTHDVILSGHSHRPHVERRRGVLYLNPGSIGPRRFTLPIALARIDVVDGELRHELLELRV